MSYMHGKQCLESENNRGTKQCQNIAAFASDYCGIHRDRRKIAILQEKVRGLEDELTNTSHLYRQLQSSTKYHAERRVKLASAKTETVAEQAEKVRGLEAERDIAGRERREAIHFIESEGHRRCDIPACNCGSWHGGNASRRLRELSDVLGGRTQGTTILGAVEALLAAREQSEPDDPELAADTLEALEEDAACGREQDRRDEREGGA